MDEQIGDNVKVETAEVETKEKEVKPTESIKEKRRSKEERAKRKDDKRLAEQVWKGLSAVHTIEDKLEVMCKKYSETVEENRKLQMTLKQYEKKMLTLQREKEQFQSERSKAALMRNRLESLCRELQKQNKAVKEESLLKIREQDKMRRELTEKFQGSLAHIKTLMNLNIEKNAKMHEENLETNKRFQAMCDDIILKEQELRNVQNQMKKNMEVHTIKFSKILIENDILTREKQQLIFKLKECKLQVRQLQATEVSLRSQVSMYSEKYDEFQSALPRCTKVYGEFNEEMERISKKVLTLEKETSLWKQRWESSHAAQLEMAADREVKDLEITSLNKKLLLLQDLCKVFQSERTYLLVQLRKKERLSASQTPAKTDTTRNNKPAKQAEELSKDCLKLQDTYRQLQLSLSKVSETINNDMSEGSKENGETGESANKEHDKLDTTAENKETERLESKTVDTGKETSNELNQVEPLQVENSEDTEQLANEKTTTEEQPSIKESETSDTEDIRIESNQVEYPLIRNQDIINAQECGAENSVCKEGISNLETNNIESSRLQPEEENDLELKSKDTSNGVEQDTKPEISQNMRNLCNEVQSIHTETETIIGQLYEAIDSVRQETVQDSDEMLKKTIKNIMNGGTNKHSNIVTSNENGNIHNISCTEVFNERLEGNADALETTCANTNASESEISVDCETVPIRNLEINENSDATTESITSLPKVDVSPKEESIEVNSPLIKTESGQTKTSKPGSVKNGKRKKK